MPFAARPPRTASRASESDGRVLHLAQCRSERVVAKTHSTASYDRSILSGAAAEGVAILGLMFYAAHQADLNLQRRVQGTPKQVDAA